MTFRKLAKAFFSCALLFAFIFVFTTGLLFAEAQQFDESKKEMSIQWKPLLGQTLLFLGTQHAFRFATEQDTRSELKGPFVRDYLRSVGNMHGWGDGDPFRVNYVGHPMQGAITGFLLVQNDPKYRRTEFGMTDTYWKSRLRAAAYAWAYSMLFEIGPAGEASIGNVQSHYQEVGFVDHVVTPTLGLGWMMAEDAIDKYIIKRMEAFTQNRQLRILARVGLNPTRSYANVMGFRRPWQRDTRPGVSEYDPHLWAIASTGETSSGSRVAGRNSFLPTSQSSKQAIEGIAPRVPSFELSAYYSFSTYSRGGTNSRNCSGGGATGAFQLNPWLGAVIDVGGCQLSSNNPNITGDSLTYLFGPRFSARQGERWTLYTDFLVGGNKLTLSHFFPERIPTADLTEWNKLDAERRRSLTTVSSEANSFAMSIGVGVDMKVRRGIAIRLGNLQYMRTSASEFLGSSSPGVFRFTTGFVLRAGDL